MQRQAYDPRLRNDVARTGNIHIFDNLEIPSSTMRTWRARGQVEFVTIEPDHAREADLRDRLERAERRLLIARAKIVLLTTVLRVLGVCLEHLHVPTAVPRQNQNGELGLLDVAQIGNPSDTSPRHPTSENRPPSRPTRVSQPTHKPLPCSVSPIVPRISKLAVRQQRDLRATRSDDGARQLEGAPRPSPSPTASPSQDA